MFDKLNVPQRYLPKQLSKKDRKTQKANLRKSRKLYKKGTFFERPKIASFKSKKSSHLNRARSMYNVEKIGSTEELSKKTHCSREALEKIINKGRGAYYSSGSRPNQTAESWGIARLASSITSGNASAVDYHILVEGCSPNSKPLQLASKTRKRLKQRR